MKKSFDQRVKLAVLNFTSRICDSYQKKNPLFGTIQNHCLGIINQAPPISFFLKKTPCDSSLISKI